MTNQEWTALIEILNRTPMTQAERLWIQALITREMQRLAEQKSAAAE
jgi:hypothetical protein